MSQRLELVDTHCHVHFSDYDADRSEVLKSSFKAGVNRIICVGCSLSDSQKAIEFAGKNNGVWATAGAHPHDGIGYLNDPDSAAKLDKLLAQPKVVAIGEIGLDYYRDITPKDDQQKILREQIEIGLGTKLPFVFHVREAWDDFWKIFDSYKNINGTIHSFAAIPQRLDEALGRGLYVSLNGMMTYTKNQEWVEAAKLVPLDKLLLETDAPFLTPLPDRGKRCEPRHVANTCEFLADIRRENPAKLASATTDNAVRLFDLSEQKLTQ